MSDTVKDGGPAFPGGNLPAHPHHPNGMSLRDWFAGQALSNHYTQHETDPGNVAEWAYALAQAMLVQKEKHDDQNN